MAENGVEAISRTVRILLDKAWDKAGELDQNTTVTILTAVAVILFTIVLLILLKRQKNLRRGVLLVGLSDSGKTLIFSHLAGGKKVDTYTSMKENSATISIPNKGALRLLDLPGNERLRIQYLDEFKSFARGVIFVIDSLSFSREIRDVAEFLYTVLSDGYLNQNCRYYLIACNKQAETMAKSSKVIQSQLEKELNTIRMTRSAALDSTSETGNNNAFLGKRGRDFSFKDLRPLVVEFAECSAKGKDNEDDADLEAIEQWLAKIA